ncbi:MAG: hypothetical protein CMN32_01440 [Saprospirales bacterium]|nr:hypothetical protein [Saprospirales bacterium]
MNKNILTGLFFFFLFGNAIPSLAQQDVRLPGVVVEQNSRTRTGSTKHIEGAFVLATGASPARSDASGKFTLVFADKPAGDLVRIQVKKPGYVVVNDRELENAAVLSRRRPLKVVLCNEQTLRENQLAYYRIAEDIALRQMQDRLAQLQKDEQTRRQIIAGLEAELDRKIADEKQLMAVLEEVQMVQQLRGEAIADRLLLVNLDDAGDTYVRAHEAFLKGNISRAIAILDSVDNAAALAQLELALSEDKAALNSLSDRIAKQEKQKEQLLQQVLLKARLLSLEGRFTEAEEQYALALKYDPENVDILWELAQFQTHLNRFTKALELCEAALAKPCTDRQRAGLLNIKGVVLMKQNKSAEARTVMEEALGVQLELIKTDSVLFLPHLAMLLENLGHIYYNQRELRKAQAHYEQAIFIWRDLVAHNPEGAYAKAASTLGALALVYRDYGQPAQADTLFRQSLFLLRQLAAQQPGKYDADLATTLGNLGLLYSDWADAATADDWLRESGAIWQQLFEANPLTYQPDLARNLQNRGRLYVMNGQWALADSCLSEAMNLYAELEAQQPGAYQGLIAATLNLQGVRFEKTGKPLEAMRIYEEVIGMREKLAARNPEMYEPVLWTSYMNVLVLLKNRMLATGDTSLRSEGKKLWQELKTRMDAHPDIAAGEGELIQSIRKDVGYFEAFFANADADFLTREAALAAANFYEENAGRSGKPEERLALQQLAVDTLRAAFGKLKGDSTLSLRLGQALGGLGTYAAFAGNFEKAESSVQEALQYAPGESWLFIPLASSLVFQGKLEAAKAIYEEWMNKPYYKDDTFKNIFLRDLQQLEALGFSHPAVEEARAFLQKE